VTVGVDDTIRAANFDAIDLLLVAGSSMIPGWACRNCGWLALSGPDCSTCGSEAIAVDDIVDNLLIKVRRAGGRTEHIASTSDLDQYLLAARIRFPVPAVNEA
jgi:peptide subunit release factor 1 (eRF1)